MRASAGTRAGDMMWLEDTTTLADVSRCQKVMHVHPKGEAQETCAGALVICCAWKTRVSWDATVESWNPLMMSSRQAQSVAVRAKRTKSQRGAPNLRAFA